MERIPTKIVIWIYIYWILLINLLVALTSPVLTGLYDYSFIIPNTVFAVICATTQLHVHLVNNKQPLTFFRQLFYFYLVTAAYVFSSIFILDDGSITFSGVAVLLAVSLFIAIPLALIALFVYKRIIKYDTEKYLRF